MSRGFTLVELLVTLTIIGILSAIAVPSYSGALTRAQRNEARLALLKVQHAEERHYQFHFSYTDRFEPLPQDGGLGLATRSETGSYVLSVRLLDGGQRYVAVARANPSGRQARDQDCAEITLDHSGERGATNSAGEDTRERCW